MSRSGSVERGPYGRGQQGRQLRDVVEGIEVEDGLLNGGLAVCGDHGVSQAAVLVDDVGVGEPSVAGAAWVAGALVAGLAFFECQTPAGRQPLVLRELVVGLFVVGVRA